MPTLINRVINNLITLSFLDLEDHPILEDFDSLWEQIKADNNCTRNYYNHVATWYGGVDYAYTGVRHYAQSWHDEFGELARALEEEHGFKAGYFNCLLANLYTGKGIARHSDDEAIFMENDGTVGAVATVSLGGTAIATINSKDPKCFRLGKNFNIKLTHGSCYLMPEGNFQNEYTHSVSKPDARNPRRISLTFRHIP
jgi:alkylated DNA repair dioxygenase AlkB